MAYNWADYVLNCMNTLESDAELTIPVKNQIRDLKPEVRLLGTILRCSETKRNEGGNAYYVFTRFQAVLQDAGTELTSLILEASEGSMVALDRKVSAMLEEIRMLRPGIKEFHLVASELTRGLSVDLKVPVNYKAEMMAPVKSNIDNLEKKLRFFRNLLAFTAEQKIEPDNMKDIMIHAQDLADNAESFSQLYLIDETDENMVQRLEPHTSDLQWKIQPIRKEFVQSCIEIFLGFRRGYTLIIIEVVKVHHPILKLIVDLLDPLLDDVMELADDKGSLTVPVKDQIVTLQENLEFLRLLILHPLQHEYAQLREELEYPLEQIEDAAILVASLVCELSINKVEENAIQKMNVTFSDLLEKIKGVKTQVTKHYQDIVKNQSAGEIFYFESYDSVDSLIHDLEDLLNTDEISSTHMKHQIATINGKLVYLKSFFRDVEELRKPHEDLKILGRRVLDMASKVQHAIDFASMGYYLPYCMLLLSDDIEEIKPIMEKVAEIYEKKTYGIGVDSASIEEVVVGFEDQAQMVIENLLGEYQLLDFVSIVGMPGCGKTTLAKKVYDHPLIRDKFYVCAWCSVSETYQKRDMLLDILGDVSEITNEMHRMNEVELSALLWRCLKGKKYLVIMDDLWDIQALDDLRRCFPDDKNQSRIIITTRHLEVASKAKSGSKILSPRPFSDDESWELLQEKVFLKKKCPQGLLEVGKKIAKRCEGLPLSVVLVSGLLGRMEKTEDKWEQIAESLSSYVVGGGDRQCMGILEMSYKHLPNPLKSCLLYFGAFPEDGEIPVQKLIRLWIAEGYIIENGLTSLEDEAEAYLMDLISRSLVIGAKTKANGGVKACRVHDLLREFCLEKAKEEKFLQLIQEFELFDCELPRVCIYSTRKSFAKWRPPSSQVQALLLFAPSEYSDSEPFYDVSSISQNFMLLRVLDWGCIAIDDSFCGIELLIHLRYLAVRLGINHLPPSIAKLENLQTFLVKGRRGEVVLPNTIWKMARLRHLHIHDRASFSWKNTNHEDSLLDNLVTLSTPSVSYGEDAEQVLRRFPSLRKLKCIFLESWNSRKKCNQFPLLNSLSKLESLKVFYHGKVMYPCEFSFPANLRKLTLSKFRLPWSELSTIGKLLPNLEVLKLLFKAFEGKTWQTSDEEFPNLKFLKLDSLDIAQWDTDGDHFPSLQRLVLQRCKQLGEIPSSLGDINTLRTIEVQWCSRDAVISAREIQKEQEDYGNEELKVHIYPLDLQEASSSLGSTKENILAEEGFKLDISLLSWIFKLV